MDGDRARDRILMLSRGLFGAPSGQADRDRKVQAAERNRFARDRAGG